MSARADLLALDEAALIMLANRGLYKRATKDLEKGNGPKVEVKDDGTVIGHFSDVTTTMAPGVPFKHTECTCGATGSCRHRVALVLAFQAEHDEASPRARPPLDVSDEDLEARLGSAFKAALRTRAKGYTATVRYDDPPVVLLPTCTVTFLVPWDLSHVRCDCEVGVDCEHVAMAVWALRQCPNEQGEHLVSLQAHVETDRASGVLQNLRELADELVRGGWAGALEGIEMRVAPVVAALGKRRFVWLADLLERLLVAMRESDEGLASADATECSDLLAELYMRCRAQPTPRAPAGHLYGEGVAGETKLDRVVLRALGARYRVSGRIGRLSLFFREQGSRDALVLERSWTVDEGHRPPPGPEVGRRRLLNTTVEMLSTSNVMTRGAKRRPNRVIDVSAQRLQTSILRGSGQGLDTESDYAALRTRLSTRVPLAMSPRVRAWRVVVLKFGRVELAGYDPGTQTVWGVLVDENGSTITVASEWLEEAPAAPALLGRALIDGASFLTGEAYLRRGAVWVEPLAIGFGAPLAVDLQPDAEIPRLPIAPVPLPDDPLASVVEEVHSWLGECARRGLAQIGAAQRAQAESLRERLSKHGFAELADSIDRVLEGTPRAWEDLSTLTELHNHVLAGRS